MIIDVRTPEGMALAKFTTIYDTRAGVKMGMAFYIDTEAKRLGRYQTTPDGKVVVENGKAVEIWEDLTSVAWSLSVRVERAAPSDSSFAADPAVVVPEAKP